MAKCRKPCSNFKTWHLLKLFSALFLLLLTSPDLLAQAACQEIKKDRDRLSCYDALGSSDTEKSATDTQPETGLFKLHSDVKGSLLTGRWELDYDLDNFIIRPYKPVYFSPIFYSSNVNRLPQTPNPRTSLTEALNYDHLESKIQLSFKTKLGNDLLGSNIDLWLGYTQSSYWQIYNSQESRPFRETNHEPEFIFVLPTNYSLLGYQGQLLSLSLNHQSNGQDEPLSRSWNRLILSVGFDRPDWAILFRPWWRIPEASDDEDENPGILDYVGRAELLVVHRRGNSHQIATQIRHSMKGGEDSHGSINLNWSYPCFDRLRCHAEIFLGYGESLIDYNHKVTTIGLGVALLEWF